MHRFFEGVVNPILDLAQPSRVLEIGAARGANSTLLARWCGLHQAGLDIIDTAPRFEPASFERDYSAAKVHTGRSLDLLTRLPAADVALIDGDHNWYTVYHELKTLAGVAVAEGKAFPICILHGSAWPYARRDLYYDPSNIPESYRKPWRRGPVLPGHPGIAEYGLNPNLCQAEQEGGPRNGVLTAIEDFVGEHPERYHLVHLPILFGLTIVLPVSTLEHVSGLSEFFHQLHLNRYWRSLLEIAERERCEGMAAIHRLQPLDPPPDLPKAPPIYGRSFSPHLPAEVVARIQDGTLRYRYRDRALRKSPFDLALYLRLLGNLRPRTIIEIGMLEGGSALWFADMMVALGITGQVVAVDRSVSIPLQDPRIAVFVGDAGQLDKVLPQEYLRDLPHPWLVVEDAAHTFELSRAVLDFFDRRLVAGDYVVIEDGVVRAFVGEKYQRYLDGPSRAVYSFLSRRADEYEIDTDLCDFYGFNLTYNPNAWLRRKR